MCLVCVFNFVKKAEQMYEITIFKSGERVQRGEETKIKKKADQVGLSTVNKS